ncbi:hypothetical protein FA09DRAFT_105738 [Tilletiopsis washingtonensis]|uniref:Uncharacterized protein n=1 Tax=Tilletiopsis washingtonensis TaxID=58919 RepID=A0A316Z4Q8_9BASI|nr:hypothetical protein FA09DRAFT_105738 [Tilletiopsis washingtonensis]PWN96074.1 hypothetical protein FA09DRAFT_105738 [Tilletiopsis washingtonensis]
MVTAPLGRSRARQRSLLSSLGAGHREACSPLLGSAVAPARACVSQTSWAVQQLRAVTLFHACSYQAAPRHDGIAALGEEESTACCAGAERSAQRQQLAAAQRQSWLSRAHYSGACLTQALAHQWSHSRSLVKQCISLLASAKASRRETILQDQRPCLTASLRTQLSYAHFGPQS